MLYIRIAIRILIINAILFYTVTSTAAVNIDIDGAPLPMGVSPMSSDKSTSPFTGTWIGKWDETLKIILIVESIDKDGKAKVVYAVADNPLAGFKAAWFRYDAEIVGNVMKMFGERFTVIFELSQTGRLKAIFGNGYSFGIFRQHSFNDLNQSKIVWSSGSSELLKTDLVEDDKPVNLEVVTFRPAGDGPFPLAIVNHGSTGVGNDTSLYIQTWTNAWFADVLNERGWIVAFPQRRGRGRSDGLYDEGVAVNRSQGYTCETERSLAGADRALEDIHAAVHSLRKRIDVSEEPILIAGSSRGGALSIAYAGLHPNDTRGVINFVGG